MLDCGFSPPMSILSDRNMRLGMCCCHRDKTTVLVPAGARIVYFTHSSFNEVVCCFEFTLWVGLELNTSEVFWIGISRWMIRSRYRWISVYLPWRTSHCF